jgi:hypothetical protein
LVVETLMISLGMIMRQILPQNIAERILAQDHHLMKRFLFDRAHKPLAMGIQIGTPRGQDDGFHAARLQQTVKGLGEFRISVVDQVPLTQEETLKGINQLPGALDHEDVRGMWGEARDLNTPCGQFHHHEHVVRDQAMPGRHLHREEVCGGQDLPVELQELRPTHTGVPALRRGFHRVALQDGAP